MHAMSTEIERKASVYMDTLSISSKDFYKKPKSTHNTHLDANEFNCITCHGPKGSKKAQCRLICRK
jgi:hypothetical protein